MLRYSDRLDRVRDDLEIIATDTDIQEEIAKYYEDFLRKFNETHPEAKLEALEELKDHIFKGKLSKIFVTSLNLHSKNIHKQFTFMTEFPSYKDNYVEDWLDEANEWIEWAEKLEELEEEKNEQRRDSLETIKTVYSALYDLETYVTSFAKLNELLKC